MYISIKNFENQNGKLKNGCQLYFCNNGIYKELCQFDDVKNQQRNDGLIFVSFNGWHYWEADTDLVYVNVELNIL
jgi:hypothetical protein